VPDHGQRWVVLDVGETIIDESRTWRAWADELGVPQLTFMSIFGAIVARGQGYGHITDYIAVDDWRRHHDAVEARLGGFQPEDVYPDVLSSLAGLRTRGYRVAVIGNQPAERKPQLRALGVEAEIMAMSEEMGAMKPDPDFFALTLSLLGDPDPGRVAYVGDRIDNDVMPAAAAGMRAVWLRRGPWGIVPQHEPEQAALVVGSLSELVERIDEAWFSAS
jgi:HAD superfamily hydrolase (TIGR01549 family)